MNKIIAILCVVFIMATANQVSADTLHRMPTKATSGDRYSEMSIKVKSCTAVGDDVDIVFIVTNNSSKERDVTFQWGNAFDDEGNNYRSISYGPGNEVASRSYYNIIFEPEVPVKVKVRIKKVAEEASVMKIVKITTMEENLFATLKNIPIDRDSE